jgi:hypothetical protein
MIFGHGTLNMGSRQGSVATRTWAVYNPRSRRRFPIRSDTLTAFGMVSCRSSPSFSEGLFGMRDGDIAAA